MALPFTDRSEAFPRWLRLTRPKQYQAVFANARSFADGYFTILVRPNGCNRPRLGLAVSKRSAPSAVRRNRIKRLIRESFRQRQSGLGAVDSVVISRAATRTVDNAALWRSLDRLWHRVATYAQNLEVSDS